MTVMDKKELVQRLSQKVDAAWDAYVKEMLQLSPSLIFSQAEEIAATSFCCDQLKNGEYPEDLLEYLLGLDDPLATARDQWLEDRPDNDEEFENVLWDLQEYGPEPEDGPGQTGMEMG